MKQHRKQQLVSVIGFGFGIVGLLLPVWLYAYFALQRPPRVNQTRALFQGITYERVARSHPRPILLHQVKVDLTAPGLRVLVTPPDPATDDRETRARTTSEFLTQNKLQLAINANFFYPFDELTPWDFTPRSGDRVNSLGHVISQGVTYSPPEPPWAVLCTAGNRAQILAQSNCPSGTQQAIAGSPVIVQNSRVTPQARADKSGTYARVVAAIDRSGQTLWLILVDDKQWLYSEGMTLAEVAQLAIDLGADRALNLDGGGSTTLVMAERSRAKVLNSPAHTKIPMRERPVANHLGFYAIPNP
jgi:uncharacterized protein YigE (DUF2233 family)